MFFSGWDSQICVIVDCFQYYPGKPSFPFPFVILIYSFSRWVVLTSIMERMSVCGLCPCIFCEMCIWCKLFQNFWEVLQRQLSSEITFDFCCESDLYVFHCEKCSRPGWFFCSPLKPGLEKKVLPSLFLRCLCLEWIL